MNIKPLYAAIVLAAAALPAMTAAAPFEGPFVGVQAGLNHDSIGNLDSDIGRLGVRESKDSAIGGVFAGFDYKLAPRIVVGAEAGFSIGADDGVSRNRGGVDVGVDPRHAFDISARAGYLVDDRTLVYVRGGYQNVDAKTSLVSAQVERRNNQSYDGWLAGAGIERAITDKVSARLEYRYNDVGSGGSKFDRQQALVGVAYHF